MTIKNGTSPSPFLSVSLQYMRETKLQLTITPFQHVQQSLFPKQFVNFKEPSSIEIHSPTDPVEIKLNRLESNLDETPRQASARGGSQSPSIIVEKQISNPLSRSKFQTLANGNSGIQPGIGNMSPVKEETPRSRAMNGINESIDFQKAGMLHLGSELSL